jgi:cytoskeletal protein CcmA (bactofilin family)
VGIRIARLLLLVLAALLATGGTAAAADVRQGPTVTISAGETVQDDLYAFAGTITILGTVRGDVVAAGGQISVDGTVTGDLIASGGTITVRGNVGGSVRAAGATILIDGTVTEDVVVAGGDLTIGSNGRVGRDVLSATGTFVLAGELARDLRAATGTMTIDGRVGRDVRVEVERLELTGRAVIEGSLSYGSDLEATIASRAVVRGPVERRASARDGEAAPAAPLDRAIDWGRGLVGFLALGLLVILLAPGFARGSSDALIRSPLLSLGIGAGVLIGLPILAILVLLIGLLIGGWWIALIAIALYLIAMAVSIPVAAMGLGSFIFRRTRRTAQLALALLVGAVILFVIALVPILGPVVLFLALLLGLGAMTMALARRPAEPAVTTA